VANIAGKAYGFSAMTAMKSWKTPLLRLVFRVIPILSGKWPQYWLQWVSLFQDQKRLVELSFIHFARWVIVPHRAWPRLDHTQPRDVPHYDYMLFISNFNGTWEQYIDAFSDTIPGGMNLIWRWSEKYPGAQPISPFLTYIRRVQYETDYYYSAYPGASANDVKCALQLWDSYRAFAPKAATMGPEAFAAAYGRFLASVQRCLGSTGPAPDVFDWQEEIAPDASQVPEREPALPAEPAVPATA
jgi:hypothetical protein